MLFKKFLILAGLSLSMVTNSNALSIKDIPGEKVQLKKDGIIFKSSVSTDKIVKDAKKYLGVKYRLGGNSRKGIDCSAFVKTIYKKQGKKLPRTSYTQIKVGKKLTKKQSKVGDLIFFGDSRRHVGHVGIIIDPKKQLMIHASSAKGKVVISSYNTKYYNRKYRGVRRV